MENEKTAKPCWPIGAALGEISRLSRTLLLIWMALFTLPGWKLLAAADHIPMRPIYADICAFGFAFGTIIYAFSSTIHKDALPAFSIRLLPRFILTVILKIIKCIIATTVAIFLLGFFVYAHHRDFLFYIWVALAIVFIIAHIFSKHLATKQIFVGSATANIEPCKRDDEAVK